LTKNATSGNLYHFDLIWCIKIYFSDAKLSTRKQNMGEVI